MSQDNLCGGPQQNSQYLKRFSGIAGIELVGDTILVEKLAPIESKTGAGIILPTGPNGSYKHTMADDVIEFGVVLMTGPGDVDDEGGRLPLTTKVGDIIALPMNVQWYSQFGHLKDYKMGTIGRMRDAQVMMCFSNYSAAMEALNATQG